MQPIPYIFFPGTCREAMTFYAGLFGTPDSLRIMTMGEMPAEARAGAGDFNPDAVMHAALAVGAGWIYASDDPDPTTAMAGVNLNLDFPTEAEARRVFDALAQGGEVRMPLSPMFWAPLFGMLTDRFGVRWMIGQAAG